MIAAYRDAPNLGDGGARPSSERSSRASATTVTRRAFSVSAASGVT